jgi:hypothetical protein
MVRSARPRPEELHALRVDACSDAEHVRRPGSADGCLSRRSRRRGAIGGMRALGSRHPLRDLRLRPIPRLELHARRRLILPREDAARRSARNEGDSCQDRRPSPAPRPWSRLLGRHARTRGLDCDRRRPRPSLLAQLRKESARSLGQDRIDERELRADRAQVFRLDDVWPRRHARQSYKRRRRWWMRSGKCALCERFDSESTAVSGSCSKSPLSKARQARSPAGGEGPGRVTGPFTSAPWPGAMRPVQLRPEGET